MSEKLGMREAAEFHAPVSDMFGEFAKPVSTDTENIIFLPTAPMHSRDSAGGLHHGVFGDPVGYEDITSEDTMDAIVYQENNGDIYGDY